METTLSCYEVDGVRITSVIDENGEVLSSRFDVDMDKPETKKNDVGRTTVEKDDGDKEMYGSFFARLARWYRNLIVKPYVKIRDLADPFGDRDDPDAGSDGKKAAEIGIRIDF